MACLYRNSVSLTKAIQFAVFNNRLTLKQPLFEIKVIGLDEIQKIEKELAEQYSYDEE